MKRTLIAKKPFEFSARITLQLGRESISSSTVALSELIKNSYDADAYEVKLNFYLRKKATSTLIFKDTGNGMTLDMLFDNWLKIGTDNKSKFGRSSKLSRILTGAKGLGRLGIDRLCKKVILYTKTKDMDHAIQLTVNWKKFENTGLSLSEIHHDIYKVELPVKDKYGDIFIDKDSAGTRMVLLGLKDDWDDDFLEILENELRLLVSPYKSYNDFDITLNSVQGENEKSIKISSEKFLNVAKWKAKAVVDKKGRVKTIFTNIKSETDVIQPPIEWNQWIKNCGNTPLFGPLEFEFYYMPRDTVELGKVNLRVKDWKKFMDQNRGVRLYRDHFRVRPYGEPSGKGDWLDLGYRKASNPAAISRDSWNIAPHQAMGAVILSRENNAELDDQANREGIIENEAFFQMRAFVLKVIDTLESLIHKDRVSDQETDLLEVLEKETETYKSDANIALNEYKQAVVTKKRKKTKKKELSPARMANKRLREFEKAKDLHQEAMDRYKEQLKLERKKLENEKNTLSNLASIGILTVCFGHEIRQHSGRALANSGEIIDMVEDFEMGIEELDTKLVSKIAGSIQDNIKYVDDFSALALNNIKPDKRTRKKISVPKIFDYIFNLMAATFKTMGIKTQVTFKDISREDFNVKAFEIDWESIIINLITNAIWAMETTERELRLIEVEFARIDGKTLSINFRDSGCGLEIGSEESIFLPMHSSKRDRTGNSIGTGMGLSIVKNHVVDHIGGFIEAFPNSSLGGAEFRIEIPMAK
ncbi:sensor histidine kinase [Psychromonas ossibalaenae]|uniref:sensor histidine kinase n=1 Tax=Psychromonas ossibalaenae TaxID=444922 RepID=UPI00035F1BCA|nr:sensor histidine kinase [Psychromonas ossibalaenae]